MSNNVNRRTFLKGGASVGAFGLSAGCTGDNQDSGETPEETITVTPIGNYPVTGDTVTFGFTVPLTGTYQFQGEAQQRGYELAVRDLNTGGSWVDSSQYSELGGDGLLDKEVEYETVDTGSDPETAREGATSLIDDDDAIMFTGGSSADVTGELQAIAQDRQVVHMTGLSPANVTTGSDCSRYAFRMMFNAEMTVGALAPALTDEIGDSATYYQIYVNDIWGRDIRDSIRSRFDLEGWTELDSLGTRSGRDDYRSDLREVKEFDPDVVFLNMFGYEGTTIISQASDIFGDETEVVVPIYDRSMAELAGDGIAGVYGTVVWDPGVDTTLSLQFIEHFKNEYGRVPQGPAYLAYAQTMLYASSVARTGTFNPEEVIADLEGRAYHTGLGREKMRACDHQAIRPVPVARGLPAAQQRTGDYFEVVHLADSALYPCNQPPASDCTLGSVR